MVGGTPWSQIYCGNVEFRFGDWRVIFFNDCDELDYTDSVIAPDGRECDPDAWSAAAKAADGSWWQCPLDLLSEEEHRALEILIEGASVMPAA